MAVALEAETNRVKAGLIDPKALGFRDHEARPIGEHVTVFHAAIAANGGSDKHAQKIANRATRVLILARVRRVSDLSLSKTQQALAVLRSDGLGPESINHHVRAIKAFSRWLWRDGRAREHYLAHLATLNPETDRRRRRALTHEEAARLVLAAEYGGAIFGMTGPDRAWLYALALGTGFRVSELASLTPERFDLASDQPTATVPACYTNNGKEATQPLPPVLAERLAPWLATLPPGRPVFKMPERTAEMIRRDLAAAGIPYETPSGVVDFHALRAAYISNLVSSGASVKTCQVLARRCTPSLTIGLYAKVYLHELRGPLDALADRSPDRSAPEAMAATGTDGRPISKRFATHLPHDGDESGRNLPVVGVIVPGECRPDALSMTSRETPENDGPDASIRAESIPVGSTGGGIRTHTGVSPRGILSPLRLPFRHAGSGLGRVVSDRMNPSDALLSRASSRSS
jgi:integrase